MEEMFPVLSPMSWTSERTRPEMASTERFFVAALSVWLCMGSLIAAGQESRAQFLLEGWENRPYRLSEYHPLSATRSLLVEGQVDMDGRVDFSWPNDDGIHFLELECSGAVWSLPACGSFPGGVELQIPEQGRAPFTARPGGLFWGGETAPWTPILLAQAEALVAEHEERMAADIQQSMLWGAASSDQKNRTGEILGTSIGSNPVSADRDSLRWDRTAAFSAAWDSMLAGVPDGTVRRYIDVQRWQVLTELHPDSLLAFRSAWEKAGAPHPQDAPGVALFRLGLDRFTSLEALSREDRATLGRAWGQGDLDSLAAVTAPWWGGRNADMTAAWLMARLGDGGLGFVPPSRFARSQTLPAAMLDLLAELTSHPVLGGAAERLVREFESPGALPKALRAFTGNGDLARLDDLTGSGPALWLWVDASAPSTLVQLQVLERMMQDAGRRGRRSPSGPALPRDLEWIVVDAGLDWSAFERMVRDAGLRHGGLSRIPYQIVHTGGDIRWSEAFELEALPAVRHNGPDLTPTRAEMPLPGPSLIGWLAKRP